MFDINSLIKKSEKSEVSGASRFPLQAKNGFTISRVKDPPEIADKLVKFRYADDFIKEIPLPKDGETIHAIVSGSFIFGDIMLPIAEKIGGCNDFKICTLSMGQENIDMILEMFELGLIKNCDLILSRYFHSHENHSGGLYKYIFDTIPLENTRVAVADVHTKIIMMRNNNFSICLYGSANLRSSRNVEQFDMKNDKNLYEFHEEWMNEIFEKYNVVKKPLSGVNPAGIFGKMRR